MSQMNNQKTYSELLRRSSFEDRFAYVDLHGKVGYPVGGERYIKQRFYQSEEWRQFRHQIIARDEGRDLGIAGREIYGNIIIHHLNPITADMLMNHDPCVLDPENVICVSYNTHQMIHYGTIEGTAQDYSPRTCNDTTPWKASA